MNCGLGVLGHEDSSVLDEPNAELPELAHLEEENQEIYSIACGLCHSAAIIGNGYLYTWGYVCCKLTHSGLTEQLG